MKSRIVQISVSPGGVPKRAIAGARLMREGLDGDAHRNHEHHGGPERAVCLFPIEAIQALAAEGHTVMPGALGENITTEGLDWAAVMPGVHLRLGERVLLQVSTYTSPCFNLAPFFRNREFSRVSQKRHPGWSRVYARVLVEGRVQAGDPIRVVDETEAAELITAVAP